MSYEFRRHGSPPRKRQAARGAKRAYSPPKLELIGDIADIVLGGSPGPLDSGDAGTKRPFGVSIAPFIRPPR